MRMSKRDGSLRFIRWTATRSAPPPFSQDRRRRTRSRGPSGGRVETFGPIRGSLPPSPPYGNQAATGLILSTYTLLVGSDSFWKRAAEDIARARSRVLVQAMTFEGDAAGQAVAAAVRGSRAADRRVLVDDYTRVVVSDCFVLSPRTLLDRGFRREVKATRAMFRALKAAGVGVRTTNPIAGRLARYGVRNHKKLIVADDVAYICGGPLIDPKFSLAPPLSSGGGP